MLPKYNVPSSSTHMITWSTLSIFFRLSETLILNSFFAMTGERSTLNRMPLSLPFNQKIKSRTTFSPKLKFHIHKTEWWLRFWYCPDLIISVHFLSKGPIGWLRARWPSTTSSLCYLQLLLRCLNYGNGDLPVSGSFWKNCIWSAKKTLHKFLRLTLSQFSR